MFQRYVTFKYLKLCVIRYPVVVIILVSGNKETKNPTVYGGGGEGGRGTGSPATPLPRSVTVKIEAPVTLVIMTISTAITYAENLPCATSALLRLCEVDYKLSDT